MNGSPVFPHNEDDKSIDPQRLAQRRLHRPRVLRDDVEDHLLPSSCAEQHLRRLFLVEGVDDVDVLRPIGGTTPADVVAVTRIASGQHLLVFLRDDRHLIRCQADNAAPVEALRTGEDHRRDAAPLPGPLPADAAGMAGPDRQRARRDRHAQRA